MPEQYTGGCRCGCIRYALTAKPGKFLLCHCRTCQQLSANGAMGFFDVPTASMSFTAPSLVASWADGYAKGTADPAAQTEPAGQLRAINVTPAANRSFCAMCGTPVSWATKGSDVISLSVSTLDDPPPDLKVTEHIFVGEKAGWEMLPEDGAARKDTA